MLQWLALTLFSLEINRQVFQMNTEDQLLAGKLHCQVLPPNPQQGYREILLTNTSTDTLEIRNFLPLGVSRAEASITGWGEHALSRTYLFLQGKMPVNVVCPDNAWDLGFASKIQGDSSFSALTRRDRSSLQKGQRKRFETLLYPGGSILYKCWTYKHAGNWQVGLRFFFQEKKLFDLETFDDTLFNRKDLEWIRHSYVIHLLQAWDKFYYDSKDKKFHWKEFLERGKRLYGGDDVVGIWPTWPSLGLDQRNQFDLFRDLPGGTAGLKNMGQELRKQSSHLFICYNPWDESTRSEGHLAGLGNLIQQTQADGVVLDTKGASSKELQEAADNIKPGVVMYSEGMAVPKDMPGIVAGRVHNALYYVPMLNLNKLIQTPFAIFRVAELYKEPIQREFATSFFNGYGTELNIFAPGQPDWVEEQYKYLGKTSRLLREHSHQFTDGQLTPLMEVPVDSIWANCWERNGKKIYTIYSIRPEGFKGNLLEVAPEKGKHYVDLWHHKLLEPVLSNGKFWIEGETAAFHKKWLGTNNEGEVDCLAELPQLIALELKGDHLHIKVSEGDSLKIWPGNPDYEKSPLSLKAGEYNLSLSQYFGRYEGDFIVQLFKNGELIDENKVTIPAGTPRKILSRVRTERRFNQSSIKATSEEVLIPEGRFVFKESHGDEFIPYPKEQVGDTIRLDAYYMDKFPITNAQFKIFINATHYKPAEKANFLKHWKNNQIPKGEENFPVVYVSIDDARAYANWAGKRVPTELEWQYAAQTANGFDWPWKASEPDSSLCNLGNSRSYPVGSYPKGANAFGLQDLVGSVWQLTNDEYQNGSYRYMILKGGSYFKPSSSWWYVQGGPRPLHYRQILLRVSEGFERNATVGFRLAR